MQKRDVESKLQRDSCADSWYKGRVILTYALVAFSIIFFGVGLIRVVEFKAAGVPTRRQKPLMVLHILGCVTFAATLILLAIDPGQEYKTWTTVLFFSSIGILFPVHIYVGICRKILISSQAQISK